MGILKNISKATIFILLQLASLSSYAQTRIMVEHENNTSIYDNIEAALSNASAGASVYLPGGRFALDTLKKELHLYGVGYLKINEAKAKKSYDKEFWKGKSFYEREGLIKSYD